MLVQTRPQSKYHGPSSHATPRFSAIASSQTFNKRDGGGKTLYHSLHQSQLKEEIDALHWVASTQQRDLTLLVLCFLDKTEADMLEVSPDYGAGVPWH